MFSVGTATALRSESLMKALILIFKEICLHVLVRIKLVLRKLSQAGCRSVPSVASVR